MSRIRFLHVDHLRLGSPLRGVADYPEWLRQTLSGAVRRSVGSLVELAIAGHSQFVVIAGRIAEHDADLGLAVGWMSSLAVQLRRQGIPLVVARRSPNVEAPLRQLEAIEFGYGDRLEATCGGSGSPSLRVLPRHVGRSHSESLLIELQQDIGTSSTGFVYRAAPDGIRGRDILQATSGDSLTVTAGPPQALSPDECGEYGCRVVEADLRQQTLCARFAATDTVRYAQEIVHSLPGMGATEIVSEMVRRSQQLGTVTGRTVVVDWFVDGTLTVGADTSEVLDETRLLQKLRGELQAGHSGVWPRRVRFTEASAFRVVGRSSRAISEYLLMTSRQEHSVRVTESGAMLSPAMGCPGGVALPGLETLVRAA